MKTDRKVSVNESMVYCVLMFMANAAGTFAVFLFNFLVKKLVGSEKAAWFYGFYVACCAAVGIAASLFLIRFYFRYKIPGIVPKRTDEQDRRKVILSSFLFMTLPGELLRFVLASLPSKSLFIFGFGYRFFDGLFAFPPNFVYDRIYLMPNNRMQSIDKYGYTATDNLLFAAVYLVYFLLNLFLLYLVFARAWNRYEEERRNEVRIRMDPEQMK